MKYVTRSDSDDDGAGFPAADEEDKYTEGQIANIEKAMDITGDESTAVALYYFMSAKSFR